MKQIIASVLENNMKQIIALVFLDILSYIIGNIIFCFFKFNSYSARVFKLRLAEVNFPKGIQTSACRS